MAEIENLSSYISDKDGEKVLEFLTALSKLDAVKILGVARTMGLEVVVQGADTAENVEPKESGNEKALSPNDIALRPSDEIIVEMIERFLSFNRGDKRLLLKLVRAAK